MCTTTGANGSVKPSNTLSELGLRATRSSDTAANSVYTELRQEICPRRPLRTDDSFDGIIAFQGVITQHRRSLILLIFLCNGYTRAHSWIAEQIGRFTGIIAVGVGAEFSVTEKKSLNGRERRSRRRTAGVLHPPPWPRLNPGSMLLTA